jgi:hypothetical protein
MNPLEIEPATFCLVALCLDQLRHHVPIKRLNKIMQRVGTSERMLSSKDKIHLAGSYFC